MLSERLESRLKQQRQQQCWRDPKQWIFDRGEGINFASNDYLGLRQDPRVISAFKTAAEKYGVGSGASSFVTGFTQAHQVLEDYLAQITGRHVMLFANGYTANVSVLTTLCQRGDSIVADKLCHASLIDGARYSGAKLIRFKHHDVDHAHERLKRVETENRWLITESVFSTDGSRADITALETLAHVQQAVFYLDHTHGFGVLNHDVYAAKNTDIVMAGLGKAVGCYGAFIAADKAIIDTLTQFARPHMYSTALPPALAAAILASLNIIETEPERRQLLETNIRYFQQCAQQLGLNLLHSTTPIQVISVGNNAQSLYYSERLRQQGLWVYPMRPPSVPAGQARLRIVLNTQHNKVDIERLCEALSQYQA